jgi:hypothetical protein
MDKTIEQTILDEYVKNRNKRNPYKEPRSEQWKSLYRLDMQSFSKEINSMPYRSDKLGGLLDKTDDVDTFFNDKQSDRDCDDYARAWLTWGVHNGFCAQEVIITTNEHLFKDAHVICLLTKDTKTWLCNYEPYGSFNSTDEAIMYMKNWNTYKDGYNFALGIAVYPVLWEVT